MKNLLSRLRFRIFAITAIFLVGISSVFAQQTVAIVNAGSSGTKLYAYTIDKELKTVTRIGMFDVEMTLSEMASDNKKIADFSRHI